MKKGRIIFTVVLALFLVVGIGILSSSMLVQASGCYCYGACWACIEGECTTYDGAGSCFCNTKTCTPDPHHVCCKQSEI